MKKNCISMMEHPFQQPFTLAEESYLCGHDKNLKTLEAGEVLIQEGARDRDMWLLIKGRFVVIKKVQPNFPIGSLQSGSFCGEIAWFTGLPRTASVIATEPGLVLRLRYEDLDGIDPALLLKIYHNTLADVTQRKNLMNQVLFRLAGLERTYYGADGIHSPVGYIKGDPFFVGFTPEEERQVRALPSGPERYRAGEMIFREGAGYDSFFLLLRGSALINLNQDPGLTLIHLGAERVMGMDVFFSGGQQGCNIVAVEQCEGLRISLEAFHTLDVSCKLKFYWQMALHLISRLSSFSVAKIKLEHMEGNMWFGG
ncbi:MAG: cyclic nucleotide-binding domain-containing protein [Magnetococcales bacterium]|nr:cyclic nucleotide-binding domain-containing protein [Magnetococcales bacterium]